jgi:hypothetical protein
MEMCPLKKGLTNRVMPAKTIMAGVTGDVVGCGHPVSRFKFLHPFSGFNDLSGNLVPQHQGDLVPSVPFHYIAAAYPAGHNFHQEFTRADFGYGHLFQTDIIVAVIHQYAHDMFLAGWPFTG